MIIQKIVFLMFFIAALAWGIASFPSLIHEAAMRALAEASLFALLAIAIKPKEGK